MMRTDELQPCLRVADQPSRLGLWDRLARLVYSAQHLDEDTGRSRASACCIRQDPS